LHFGPRIADKLTVRNKQKLLTPLKTLKCTAWAQCFRGGASVPLPSDDCIAQVLPQFLSVYFPGISLNVWKMAKRGGDKQIPGVKVVRVVLCVGESKTMA
jgi:hypothetical protein